MSKLRKVHFSSRGINIVGDLYLPSPTAPNRKKASLIVGHPGTGVKEQASGLYARSLADNGFVTLAFDAAHQGESGGQPRYLEDPYQRVEDFRSAVTFLSTLDDDVDPERIGAVGICASGGYVVFTAQTDVRIKAVATVCGVCIGAMTRKSFTDGSGALDRDKLHQSLAYAGKERIAEAKGSRPATVNIMDAFVEGQEYYRTERGRHPRCTNAQMVRSLDGLVTYDSFAFVEWIAPRPLLMILGSEAEKGTGDAATGFYSRAAIERAKEPKELFVVEGKGHVDLYDDTRESVPKLADFMAKALCV